MNLLIFTLELWFKRSRGKIIIMITKINKTTQHKYEMQQQMQHKIRYLLKSEIKSSGNRIIMTIQNKQ